MADLFSQRLVDVEEMRDHPLTDHRRLDLAQFEGQGVGDVPLLGWRLADEELPCLTVMVGEAFSADAELRSLLLRSKVSEAFDGRLARSLAPGIGLVVRAPDRVAHGHVAVLLKVMEGTFRRVDRKVGEIRAAEPLQLGVQIGEVASLQQWIVAEVDAGRDVLRHEGDLLGFGEEILRHAIEHQPADRLRRQHLLGDDLGWIEDVEIELVGEVLIEELHMQFPFRKVAGLDGLPHIAPVEVRIGAVDLHGLVPDHGLQPELRLPVELDEGGLVLGVDEAEGVHAEPFHEPEGSRNRPVGHDPHDHVHAFRCQADEVPEIVMGGLRLRKLPVRLGFYRMYHVGKLDRILDEEDRNIVADQVPIALLGVDLDREATHVAGEIEGALASGDRREPHEGGGSLARALEQVRPGVGGKRLVGLEKAVNAITASMHDALGNSFMVEVEDLLAKMKILDERGATLAGSQAVLIVGDRAALRRRQNGRVTFGDLVKLSTIAACRFLVMNGGRFRIVRRRRFLGHGSTPWSRADGHETLTRKVGSAARENYSVITAVIVS
ncbi:conserved hypothetical protein [Sinorhizobium medicae]|uniref:Uncharacterized protein n=1 Tax=Sinorhizobium medicae TaxID=110321 RepID=A0A508X6G3_9HYPH|nr:conserved hypothetical protein [Sinorhizobium medicae]